MKKCPYCGKEYPDDVERCLTDNEILLGGKTPMPEAEQNAITVLPSLSPQEFLTTPRTALWTDRQFLIMEVVLVCAIAFGGNILASFHTFFSSYPDSSSGDTTSYKWIYAIFRQGSVLGVLWYVLIRRGKSFADFGLAWAPKDFGWSIILRAGGSLAFYAVYDAIYFSGLTAVSHKASVAHVDHFLFGSSVSIMAILFQFLNPFFEELIARAYVMTTVKHLTNSATKAIIVSTVLQTSYHFYQGAPAAFAHGATFLIWSIYYAKTNRIAPIILAHLYSDVGSTLWYMFRQ